MGLLQISEPSSSTATVAIGIDLGTTYSLVSVVENNKPIVIPDKNGIVKLPSVVLFNDDKTTQVGLVHAEAITNPHNIIVSAKRLIGRSFTDITSQETTYHLKQGDNDTPMLDTAAGLISPTYVCAQILKTLVERAKKYLKQPVNNAVITVPAYFDETQRQAVKNAAEIAKINVLRLINEPTAAALAYGMDKKDTATVAVYDLGGGTFDISILKIKQGIFQVLATAGDTACGGDDIDDLIVKWILATAVIDGTKLSLKDKILLKNISRLAKESITSQASYTIDFKLNDTSSWHGELSVEQLNQLIQPLIDNSLNICHSALQDSGVKLDDISATIMIGGSSRIPHIIQKVGEFFACAPYTDIDPDQAVALGAAIQADNLTSHTSKDNSLLIDVTPLSLGIETMGELVSIIIPRNSSIPITKTQQFTTYKDNQSTIMIHVVQGECELVSACRSLGRFYLTDIPLQAAGKIKINVVFKLDADGMLQASAQTLGSSELSKITLQSSHGLSQDQVKAMLEKANSNLVIDKGIKLLSAKKLQAKKLIQDINNALNLDHDLLSGEKKQLILDVLAQLEQHIKTDNIDDIDASINLLDEYTAEFAHQRLKKAMNLSLDDS